MHAPLGVEGLGTGMQRKGGGGAGTRPAAGGSHDSGRFRGDEDRRVVFDIPKRPKRCKYNITHCTVYLMK